MFSRFLAAVAAASVASLFSLTPSPVFAQEATAFARYQEQKRGANENTVTIIGSQADTAYTRFAEDMQNVLDEPDAMGLRVLPILGRGGGQNFKDILFLKGIDMGIVEQDVIAYFKSQDAKLFANAESRVQYILKLSNSEMHIFARPEIAKLEDLRGKKVSFYKQFSSSAIAMETILKACNVQVEVVYLDTDLAAQKLKAGEIAATGRISGAPHGAFTPYTANDGHFLPLDAANLPAGCYDKLMKIYLPAYLKNQHYPKIIAEGGAVPTVANSTILAVYGWPEKSERYNKLAKFTKNLFDHIDKLRDGPRHPKWKEVNLAAEVPGWTRFKPAQQWLDASRTTSSAPASSPGNPQLKVAFDKFLQEYVKSSGGQELTVAQKDALFSQFTKWWQTRQSGQVTR
jgi:uncharacterized protein